MAAKPQVGFLGCAIARRPAGPAQSSALHYFARSGPTKEAHRRAINQSGGLLRSVAGQGHGRFLPVTLPRGASDQRKLAEAGTPRFPPPGGPIRGGVGGPIRGGIRGPPYGDPTGGSRGDQEIAVGGPAGSSELPEAIVRRGGSGGLNRPRRGRDPAPGRVRPMPSPGGNTIRPDKRRRQGRTSSPRRWPAETAKRRTGGCGGSSLAPGRAGWSR